MSKLKVNELDTRSGTTVTVTTGKTLDVPAGATLSVAGTQTVTGTVNLTSSTLSLPATLPATALTNATNIPAAQLSGQVPVANLGNVDTSGLEADIALLAFKTQANGNLARYNLVDHSVDSFEDASGVDASASTGESRNSSGKYYSGVGTVTATGGTITTDGDYTVHKFTANGTFTTDTAQDVEYLVVGGGGGGGGTGGGSNHMGGGGGAGGYRVGTGFPVTATSYSIVVGAGAIGGTDNYGDLTGGVSTFSTITSGGGGKGGGPNNAGTAGGSGGGGSYDGAAGAGNTPATTPAQGFAGGSSGAGGTSAGGGGASAVGESVASSSAPSGAGGAGVANDIVLAGTPVTYAGGGGGGKSTDNPGSAGAGGAGGGGDGGNGAPGVTATANTGGGGGGAGNNNSTNRPGGHGGTGIVVIRRPTTGGISNMTLVSNTQTAQAQPTKADVVLTYTNGAGTAVVNTDLIASVSRDNGTTYSAVTLVSQGTTAGHTILTANDVDISGQPAGTSMRWKVATTSQSASKDTRIHAVSLGWS